MKKFSLSLLFALMLFGMFAMAASAQEGPMTPGAKGTSITNANKTAEGVDTNNGSTYGTVIKNLAGHKTHTSYQNNTNSCASCHQTHTAKGDQLLFADTVYNTCTACHDGTLGFLNVFTSGETASMTGAGTFGGSHSSSMHMSNDSLKINAAPGGNPAVQDYDADPAVRNDTKGTKWGESFNCASCHAPHGSYSDRLLHYNPNGIGAIPASKGGNQLENVPVVETLPTATENSPADVLYRTTDGVKVTVAHYIRTFTTAKVDGKDVITYTGYAKSTAPWLYGYDNRTDGLTYWSRLVKDVLGDNPATTDVVETDFVTGDAVAAYGSTTGVYFDYDQAQAYSTSTAGATALNSAKRGFIARPVVVQMAQETDPAKHGATIPDAFWNGAPIANFGGKTEQQLKDLGYTVSSGTVKNVGVKMSQFCAACHTDYMQANSEGAKSHFGSTTAAYRHSTNSDSYTCVRCHFSHGTDAYIMKDALGRTINDLVTAGQTEADALIYMEDTNASSALKKFTNMSVCWACHNSSHAETLKNAERLDGHPIGMPKVNGITQ